MWERSILSLTVAMDHNVLWNFNSFATKKRKTYCQSPIYTMVLESGRGTPGWAHALQCARTQVQALVPNHNGGDSLDGSSATGASFPISPSYQIDI